MKKYLLSLALVSFFFTTSNAQFSVQKVIMEEFTGAWCGWCPDGHVIMKSILSTQQNAIGVAIHSGDAMEFAEGGVVANFYTSSYPGGVVNRSSGSLSRNTWAGTVNTALQGASVVTVSFDSLNYNSSTRAFDAHVKFAFTGPGQGNYRINLMVVEDGVTGTGSGYNQSNYLNNQAGHPMAGQGDPIVGYVHDHTLRAMLGGSWGLENIVTSPVNFGSNFTHTFSSTLPASWDETQIKLVAWISDHAGNGVNDREILNAEEMPLMVVANMDNRLNEDGMFLEVAPNPVASRLSIMFNLAKTEPIKVEVMNQMGQRVALIGEGYMGSGAHTLYWNRSQEVAEGMYFIRLSTESGKVLTKRVVVTK